MDPYPTTMAEQSTGVMVWWLCLGAIGVVNIAVWSLLVARGARRDAAQDAAVRSFRRRQIALSAVFVFGCAFRSFLPFVEGARFCLVDTWISNAIVARAVATFAELSLVAQWALLVAWWAREEGLRRVGVVAKLMVPLIAVAEICSWYTALTTNFAGSVIEESIWAFTATMMALSLFALWPRSRGGRRKFIGVAIVFTSIYVVFMCTVDVPMYALRWRRDQTRGTHHLTVAEGARDGWTRKIVTRRWPDWREEMPWMSLYFSAGVWISISLMRVPVGGRAVTAAVAERPALYDRPYSTSL
jgi:hypothetical protein